MICGVWSVECGKEYTYMKKKKKDIESLADIEKAARDEGLTTGQYLAKRQIEEMRWNRFWKDTEACDMSRDYGDCAVERRRCKECDYNG